MTDTGRANLPMEFSFRTREQAIERLESETFDFLIIGGGITGAGVARDAVRRGLKVALIEKGDFASGTSSASSKLVHGGLRYLESLEFGLVFEALSERAHLLRGVPHLVHPLKFYFPVYKNVTKGKFLLGIGIWLYDILSLFRAPGFHKSYSAKKLSLEIPFLERRGLKGGFSYYDASMRDDVMAMEVARSAAASGAAIVNYVEARSPVWEGNQVRGFHAFDREKRRQFLVRAKRTILCAGPWTDSLGALLAPDWKKWLSPSKGIHLVFSEKRIPVPGAVVMSHPKDGRISFVIPRPDLRVSPGEGVVIVGTTDSPSPRDPSGAEVEADDVRYLMELLQEYFPELKLTTSDIVSAYVGVRPLVAGSEEGALQKISREERVGDGPGGVTVIAGGKYTTYRRIAEQVVDFALSSWRSASQSGNAPSVPTPLRKANTREAILPVPSGTQEGDLAGRLRHSIRYEMTMRLTDFYFRRTPLFLSRPDHGTSLISELSRVWAEERGMNEADRVNEAASLAEAVDARMRWRKSLL